MAELLKGKPVVADMKEELSKKIEEFKSRGINPKLGVIRVGARPDDLYYEGSIKKTCGGIGLEFEVFEFPEDVKQEDFEKSLKDIVNSKDIHGILMFAPLPNHLDEPKIRALIPVEKDVDCLTIGSAGKVFADDPTGFPPCTPTACMEIINHYGIDLQGKHAVVLGRSLVVGKPMAVLLLRENATVTICHSRTKDLPEVCKEADILVAAVGQPRMVNADYVKEGQVVIDVGINEDPDNPGKFCGDVDTQSVEPLVDKLAPSPGGVGGVTTVVLAKHVVKACEMQTT